MVKQFTGVRINTQHIEALAKLAKKTGDTVSYHIQQAVREYLAKHAKDLK